MIALKHILVATDFSECSEAAVEQGRALAAAFDASLHLLHVAIAPLHEPWAGDAPGEKFVHIVRRLEAQGLQRLDRVATTTGLPKNRLVFMGSVAERVVRLAPCPVLTVHVSPALTRQALALAVESGDGLAAAGDPLPSC